MVRAGAGLPAPPRCRAEWGTRRPAGPGKVPLALLRPPPGGTVSGWLDLPSSREHTSCHWPALSRCPQRSHHPPHPLPHLGVVQLTDPPCGKGPRWPLAPEELSPASLASPDPTPHVTCDNPGHLTVTVTAQKRSPGDSSVPAQGTSHLTVCMSPAGGDSGSPSGTAGVPATLCRPPSLGTSRLLDHSGGDVEGCGPCGPPTQPPGVPGGTSEPH